MMMCTVVMQSISAPLPASERSPPSGGGGVVATLLLTARSKGLVGQLERALP